MRERVRRSMLYAPADDTDMMHTALGSAADAVIFDLEDAVPRDELETARGNVVSVSATADASTERCVRINGVGTAAWLDDVLAVSEAVDTVVVPTVESPEAVVTVASVVARAADDPPDLVVTLETPAGVLNAESIATRAAALDVVTTLSLGFEDYARSLATTDRPDAVRDFVAVTVASAAAAGDLDPFYTVYPDYEDLDALRETAVWARRLGYLGMKAIHPEQVPVINEAFTPSAEAAAEAERFVTAYEESDRDSLSVDGTFLDAAVVDQYRRLLARRRAASEADPEG
jgi:citrate lyase subunit beta/citryl-CoA lyase